MYSLTIPEGKGQLGKTENIFGVQLQRDRLENIHHPLFFIQGPMTSPPRSVSLSPSLLNRQELCFIVCLISHMCSVTQLWPILCDPMDYSSPASSVPEIFQARILKWVAISFSGNITYIKGRLKKKRITTTKKESTPRFMTGPGNTSAVIKQENRHYSCKNNT